MSTSVRTTPDLGDDDVTAKGISDHDAVATVGGVPVMPALPESLFDPPPATFASTRHGSWLRRLLPLVKARRRPLITMMASLVVAQAVGFTAPLLVRATIDQALIAQTRPIEPLVAGIALLGVIGLGAGFVHRYHLHRLGALIDYDLRSLLQAHLSRQTFHWFDHAQTGHLISRAHSDIRSIEMFLAFSPALTIMFGSFFVALVIMMNVHVGLALIAVSTLPIVMVVGIKMRRRVFPVAWLVQQRTADLAGVVEENLAGAHVVRSMAAERHQIAALDVEAERQRWAADEEIRLRGNFQPTLEALPRFAVAMFLLYGGWLAIEGRVTVGTLILFASYVGMLQQPFRMLGFVVMMGQRARASADRIFQVIDHEPEIVDADGAVSLHEPRGIIRFEDVHFGYGDGPEILSGVSFDLQPGQTVALVGRTGSGKSTIARLLPRFYDVRSGTVTIDGTDVRDVTLASLRAHVGMVFDEAFLFTASVRENIAFADPIATDATIMAAAEAAGAAEFIRDLPEGLDTRVGERGYTLSGGQRQRISIARALLANPPILILDDATSAVDVQVEEEIHRALEGLLAQRTTLVVAHRLSTIALADKVLFLENGRIVDSGTHVELLSRQPAYADVVLRGDDQQEADQQEADQQQDDQQQDDTAEQIAEVAR